MHRADLVVHDGAQAHDADVDVLLLAHQSGVLQRPPARQRVAATDVEMGESRDARRHFEGFVFLKGVDESHHTNTRALDQQENRCHLWKSLHPPHWEAVKLPRHLTLKHTKSI